MGYRHIDNLYKNQSILAFRECFALEKVHGTSAHISYVSTAGLSFFSGGENHERFVALFDQGELLSRFSSIGHEHVTVYGEAYGGKQQGQSWRYGKELKFVAFEVRVGAVWLAVPQAERFAAELDLRFVDYARIQTDIDSINTERDRPTTEGKRNGVEGDHPREGVVLRPPFEVRLNNGDRVIAKHKRDDERETKSPRKVIDPAKLKVLEDAQAISDEWVTPTRLEHVLQTFGSDNVGIEQTREVINRMIEDVFREGAGEIVDSREARSAIGSATARMFKEKFKASLKQQ